MKTILSLAVCLFVFNMASAQTNVIYPNPARLNGGGTQKFCGASFTYSGYVIYSKSIANGWGWSTNIPPCYAVAGTNLAVLNTNVMVTYGGKNGDSGCGLGKVTLPNPAYSQYYRFGIYFPAGWSGQTTNYPVTLVGFNP